MAPKIPKTVVILGIVSFLTDSSSEMIYPLLPIFLSQTLGASALALGMIEGLAETMAAILKLLSGIWADRVRHRKPFLLAGYGLAGVARPLIGLAGSWPVVLGLRVTDRIGKGVRSSPRDAMIADATPAELRGAAYGFHRAMDHAGAVAGPLIAAGLLALGLSLRNVFLLAGIPAFLTILVLAFVLKEKTNKKAPEAHSPSDLVGMKTPMSRDFKIFLSALLIFTLGNSTDAFLLLRLSEGGVPAGWVATLWAAHHIIKMTSTYWGGTLSDKLGRKKMILAGWAFYALVYLGFAHFQSLTALIVIFLAYGIFYGLTEPAEKALVADLAPQSARGKSFGFYHFAIGLSALPASLLFGWIWQRLGYPVAFMMGASLAALAFLILTRMKRR